MMSALSRLHLRIISLIMNPLPFNKLHRTLSPFSRRPSMPDTIRSHSPTNDQRRTPRTPRMIMLILLLNQDDSQSRSVITNLRHANRTTSSPALTANIPTFRHRRDTSSTPANLRQRLMRLHLLLNRRLAMHLLIRTLIRIRPTRGNHLNLSVARRQKNGQQPDDKFLLRSHHRHHGGHTNRYRITMPIVNQLGSNPQHAQAANLTRSPFDSQRGQVRLIRHNPVPLISRPSKLKILLHTLRLLSLLTHKNIRRRLRRRNAINSRRLLRKQSIIRPVARIKLVSFANNRRKNHTRRPTNRSNTTALNQRQSPRPPRLQTFRLLLHQVNRRPNLSRPNIRPLIRPISRLVNYSPIVSNSPSSSKRIYIARIMLNISRTSP